MIISHIALWRTRSFLAAHMTSKIRLLFITQILLCPFATCECSLEEVGLLCRAYDSKVVLGLSVHRPSLQHTITLSNLTTPLQHSWSLQDMDFLYSTIDSKLGLGWNGLLCSKYATLQHMRPLCSTWHTLCGFVAHMGRICRMWPNLTIQMTS